MKIKPKTKKIIVLSVMVLLLVATGVLNFVLNDKISAATQNAANDDSKVTQTFFAAAKSERDATRESEFLYLDAIVNSQNSSSEAKKSAEDQKLVLVNRIEQENAIETLVRGNGFENSIVTISDSGVNIVVQAQELTQEQANQILASVLAQTDYEATEVKIIPYC